MTYIINLQNFLWGWGTNRIKAFPMLWINLVVKSHGTRQFLNVVLKRRWGPSQRYPHMTHFITFHPICQYPEGLNAGSFNCLLTYLPQSKLYLSKFPFPFINQSVPVSRRKSVLPKTRTMFSLVDIFYHFLDQSSTITVLEIIIKLNKTKEYHPQFLKSHDLYVGTVYDSNPTLKSYFWHMLSNSNIWFLLHFFVVPGVKSGVWGMLCSTTLLNPQYFLCLPFLFLFLLRHNVNKCHRLPSN